MPSELKSQPGTFQQAMNVILVNVHWQLVLVYLDDIVLFSKVQDAQIKHMKRVLTVPCQAGLTIKLRSLNSTQTLSTSWVMSFILDSWQYHNT